MITWNGDIIEMRYRKRYIIERPFQGADVAPVTIVSFESQIDENLAKAFSPRNDNSASRCDNSGAQVEANIFATFLNERLETAKVAAMSLGSMDTGEASNLQTYLNLPSQGTLNFNMNDMTSEFDSISTSVVEAGKQRVITPGMLAKIWRIDYDSVKGTLETTTQLNRQDASNSLSRKFSTNDRMLQYKRINSCFFIDTMIATETGTSSRGFPMRQVFVSDKGFVAVHHERG